MSRGPARELKAQIESRLASRRGAVWTPVDFLDLGPRAAVDKALQRLAQTGILSRIDRGLYARPATSTLTRKATTPDQRSIIDAVARRDQPRGVADGHGTNEIGRAHAWT